MVWGDLARKHPGKAPAHRGLSSNPTLKKNLNESIWKSEKPCLLHSLNLHSSNEKNACPLTI
jgi:hypothetical protein